MDINLDEMQLADLKALRTQVDRAIASFEDRRRREALAAAEQVARDHGFNLSDLAGGRQARTRRAAAGTAGGAAQYAHPEDASQTWSGRGRRPRWVNEQIEAGRSLDDLKA